MKKIVFLHPAHYEQIMGGAELHISYVATYLKKLGHEIHFIYEDQAVKIKNKNGFCLHPIKKIKIQKKLGQRWFLYVIRIKKILTAIQPDVIYTRFHSSWSNVAAQYSKANNRTYLLSIASDSDVFKKNVFSMIFRPFDLIEKYMVKTAYRHATRIVVQNKFQEKALACNYNRKGYIIPQMTPKVEGTSSKKANFPIQILWIANLKPLKRPELFIQLAKINRKNIKYKFTMVGLMSPQYENLIEKAVHSIDNFTYKGPLPNNQVNKLLCRSHILINSSDYEGFSNTFVQAWMRKVVVLSMNSNPNDILTNYKIGFICPNIKDLDKKLQLLTENKSLRITMSERSYKYAIQNHTTTNNLPKIKRLMNL